MSSFKVYAKQAKQRLKNNFWSDVIDERNQAKQTRDVVEAQSFLVRQKQELKERIYNADFESDEEFYRRVKQILSGEEVVTNPLSVLIDHDAVATMSESQKQAYLLKLSNRFQQAVERYAQEKREA